ncbi:MAG: PaaI family thioesterase [Cellvibrionaceae bacterium]
MSDNNFFSKIQRGELPPPNIAKTLNATFLEVNTDKQTLLTSFDIGEEFLNPAGFVQGGIVSAMLDDTMGPCLASLLGENQFAPTLSLKVSFIKGANPGKFTGKGKVIKKGKSICYLSSELVDADGELVATATATAKIIRMPN